MPQLMWCPACGLGSGCVHYGCVGQWLASSCSLGCFRHFQWFGKPHAGCLPSQWVLSCVHGQNTLLGANLGLYSLYFDGEHLVVHVHGVLLDCVVLLDQPFICKLVFPVLPSAFHPGGRAQLAGHCNNGHLAVEPFDLVWSNVVLGSLGLWLGLRRLVDGVHFADARADHCWWSGSGFVTRHSLVAAAGEECGGCWSSHLLCTF